MLEANDRDVVHASQETMQGGGRLVVCTYLHPGPSHITKRDDLRLVLIQMTG
jgi:hypothetical protein